VPVYNSNNNNNIVCVHILDSLRAIKQQKRNKWKLPRQNYIIQMKHKFLFSQLVEQITPEVLHFLSCPAILCHAGQADVGHIGSLGYICTRYIDSFNSVWWLADY